MPDTESANGESDSFDRCRQLWSDVVCNAEDTRHVADDLLSEFLKGFK